MTVIKNKLFYKIDTTDYSNNQRGASLLEILLVMTIVAFLAPFVYNQVNETSREIRDIATAKQIINLREPALNFVRLNQDIWPDYAQIKLDEDELMEISEFARAAFIDKYLVKGAVITDIYLAFSFDNSALRSAQIAKHIGLAAATVGPDGVAYGSSWAVAAPDFKPGDLVYRINYNFSGDDNSKYLHRGSSGEDDFNVMRRALNMGKFDIYNIGTLATQSGKMTETITAFAEAQDVASVATYYTNGANMDASFVKIGTMRVNGDITGFRNININKLNREGFSTNGTIITDRARVNNSVNVGRNMNIKSDTSRTISGFAGIVTHSVATPFLSATEMIFHNNFGLTVSGELLMSTTSPIKIGSWIFPSMNPPRFSSLELTRGKIPTTPKNAEFDKLIKTGWKDLPAKQL